MFKYMKYEIRGTYKFILTLIATVLGASTGIQLYTLNAMKGKELGRSEILLVLLGLVIFGAFITAFFYIISSFRKELYEDRGYLTFSLPLGGKQVVGAKLWIALLWSAILGLSFVVYNLILGSLLFGTQWIEGFKMIFSYISANLALFIGFTAILSVINTLLLIYFSMTLSKVSIKNKKIGGLWFVIFLVLNVVINYLIYKIGTLVPYYLNFNFTSIINGAVVGNQNRIAINLISNGSMPGVFSVNIGSYLLNILVIIGSFLGTSYLIEHKVEI